jgi:hypothetical protein
VSGRAKTPRYISVSPAQIPILPFMKYKVASGYAVEIFFGKIGIIIFYSKTIVLILGANFRLLFWPVFEAF